MAPTPARVALFGGSFNPIHRGHLAVARAALGCGLVDEVRFVVAGNPPHKLGALGDSAEDRWCMAVLATLDEPRFRVARWEIDRGGVSYAIDTLEDARRDLPGAELWWLIGADAMALIDTWKDYRRLFEVARFLVISREGFDEAGLRATLAAKAVPADRYEFLHMPPVDISSTELRRAIPAGEDVSPWLPPMVATYVARYGLYQAPQEVRT